MGHDRHLKPPHSPSNEEIWVVIVIRMLLGGFSMMDGFREHYHARGGKNEIMLYMKLLGLMGHEQGFRPPRRPSKGDIQLPSEIWLLL